MEINKEVQEEKGIALWCEIMPTNACHFAPTSCCVMQVEQTELEEHDEVSKGKYTIGLGQVDFLQPPSVVQQRGAIARRSTKQ